MEECMMKLVVALLLLPFTIAATPKQPREVAPDLKERAAKLPRTVIDYDRSLLSANEKQVVAKLIEASRDIDEIFWRMVSEENPALRKEMQSHPNQLAREFFDVMKGRWDRLEGDEPFLAPFGSAGKKPDGAAFYPLDMTIRKARTSFKV
jgi:hypothetical protein